jgi:hypothetical protein
MIYENNMSAPPNTGLWTTAASRANMGSAVAGVLGIAPALSGEQQIRNAPSAAAAAQVAPQQPPQSQLQPQPGPWQYFLYDTPQMLQAYINATYEENGPHDTETTYSRLYLNAQMDVLLAKFNDYIVFKDIKFPPVKYLNLQGIKKLESLKYFNFPDSLTELVVMYTGVNSLVGVKFPPNLIRLRLDHNQIKSLDGVEFPFSLQSLDLTNNQIKSLNGVKFPPNLTYLGLSNNNITSLLGAHFPPNLTRLSLGGNPISSLKGMIEPSPNVMQLLGEVLPTQFNYFREKSALKAARQSQKTELKELTDLSQQSMQNQLSAVTSFLREGMEARAREHNEQVRQGNVEIGRPTIFVRIGVDLYYVPFAPTMTVQDVLDYLNTNYYISALIPSFSVMRVMFESKELESSKSLANCQIQNESTLHAVGKIIHGGRKRRNKSKKRSQKRRNKSKKN